MIFKKKAVIFLIILVMGFWQASAASQIKTPAEEGRYVKYSQYEEVVRFISLLDAKSEVLQVRLIGRTKEVDNYPARDLLLCVLTEEGVLEPEALNRKKATVLYIASQHGNEQSAKEAALRLLRDLAVGELKPLLKKINVLIIPQANPYGNYYDVRQNEIGLDLNRDHVKLEGESTKAIHQVFSLYQPEVTLDIHEKGDDYYRVSVGCVSNLNINQALQDYSRQTILRGIEEKLTKKKIAFHEYLVRELLGSDTSSGARIEGQTATREMMLRYSTTDLNDGRNSLGIYETLAFIQEGASRHDLQTLQDRTDWQYEGLRALAEIVASNGDKIISLVREKRANLIKRAEERAADDSIHLKMQYARNPREPELVLKAFESSSSSIRGILKVDKKAGDYITFEDLEPYRGPSNLKVVTRVVKNWFPLVESRLTVSRPAGYIIPGDRLDLIEVLLQHGIQVKMVEKDSAQEVIAYKTIEVVPAKADYLAPERLEVKPETLKIAIKRGDFYISCSQPAANLIPCLLEPQSDYGLIRYFKFRLIPEVGDYFSIYRVDKAISVDLIDFKPWK
ncbi:MAG: DUF2817 domain-containing protein [Acidobacteriota bacterium]|nr:DUF2817 domain-containing protein [Acidobacteriota bacterium]MDW3228543.1 DUF2817 domain-containing protein [Acidobacteriota bacterium]MDY0231501.1 DUF2817 domain-containing protein [Candidatus Saccharicenans sp.]